MPQRGACRHTIAAWLGFTWLATVPPTVGLVSKLFGTRYLATLFGLTLLTHQIGGFLAAAVNLPIREARLAPASHAALT